MGQLVGVLGAVGGFVATYGSAIVTLASVAASIAMAFVPRGGMAVEGPRLSDSTVMTSTYGNAIPLIIGRCRVAGNMIWATEIEEVKTTKKIGGKGSMFGGPDAKQTTYSYYGNFAMAFGRGDGGGCFAKIFADKKLIYDATGGSAAIFKYPEATLRFYIGGDTQEPDPLMEADLGAGNVSAHKDLTYVVVENLPLLDFGNRIPHFEAVFDSSAEASYDKEETTGADLPFGALQCSRYDRLLRQFYTVNGPSGRSGSYSYIWRMDMEANAQSAYLESSDPGPPYLFAAEYGDSFGIVMGGVFPHSDGKLFVAGHTEFGDGLVRINPYTLTAMTVWDYSTGPPLIHTGNFKDMASISFTREHPTGIKNYLLLCHDPKTGPPLTEAQIWVFDRDDEAFSGPLMQVGQPGLPTGFEFNASCVDRDGIVWIAGRDDSTSVGAAGNRAHLLRVEVNRTTGLKLYGVPLADEGVTAEIEIISLTDLGLHDPHGIAYDTSSHSLVFAGQPCPSNNEHKWIRWDIDTRSVVVERTFDEDVPAEQGFVVASVGNPVCWQMGVHSGELIAVTWTTAAVERVIRIRVVDLSYEELESPDNLAVRMVPLWDPTQNQAWFMPYSGTTVYPQQVQWGRCVEAPVPLEDVITELITLTRELTAADIDVTDSGILAQDLRGLIMGRQMPVRRVLESLIFPYQLDIVESDAKLKFTTRGGGSARTIAENDLGAQTTGRAEDKLVIDRSQEAEVPARIDLRYLDWDRDFLEGNQSAKRHRLPYNTQYSPEVAQLNVPVVMNAQEAARAVETGLYNAWVGRTGYKLALGTKHVDLDPTDVITVQKNSESFLMRLMEWQLEDGFVTAIAAASEDAETYTSDADGETAITPVQSFGPPGSTELFFLDIPLLRDVDDTNQLGTGVYVAFGRHQSNWRNAVAERSVDGGLRWDRFSTSRDSAPWGFLTSVVSGLTLDPDNKYPDEINRLDEGTQIEVQIVADASDLASITRLELWTGTENAMVIGEGDTAEIVRFQNVSGPVDGVYTFDTLLRGRRGTEEAAINGHSIGDPVVFVHEDWINREGIDLGRLTRTDFYRAVSIGEFVEAAAIRSWALQGNDLRPYPVARPVADAPPGPPRAPVTITWNRRTRVGGNFDLLDGIRQDEVPVGEEAEAYTVVLLDKISGDEAVMKTATDDAVGVTFDGADHTTANYNDGDPLDVVIYQTSAVVGRGLPRPVTL